MTRQRLLGLLSACAAFAVATAGLAAQTGYVPERVYQSKRSEFTDFEAMLADVADADVLFVGEQHDDPNTHRLELAVLQGLSRRRPDVIVALEMFERDVQEPLDRFLAGTTLEAEFLSVSRPWPRYATDYKPLVDFAASRHWPVVAGNVPRALASEVSKSGLTVLAGKSDTERKWFARDQECPTNDDYFKRFQEAMGSHPGADGAAERFYFAQCLKDETMAESIAQAYAAGATGGKRPLVVHFNGAFHSDFGEGTASRAKRRLPGKRVVVTTMLPVDNLDKLSPDKAERKRADYLIYTLGKPASAPASR